MKMKYKVLGLSLIGVLSFEVIAPSFASQTNYGAKYLSSVTLNAKADDTTSDSEVPQVDTERIDKAANLADGGANLTTDDLNKDQLANFEQAAQFYAENANLPTEQDTQDYKQALIDFYNPNSKTFNDLEATTDKIVADINENHETIFDKVDAEKVLAASHGWISVRVAGDTINLALSMTYGGVARNVGRALVKKYGLTQAKNLLSRTLRNKLISMGVSNASGVASVASDLVTAIFDPGLRLAKWVDSRDKIRNNGYWELW